MNEIDDLPPKDVTRVVFCSGKVYFDLLEARRADEARNVAIVRIEQLYPFPSEDYAAALAHYPNAREIVWCQEEPQNQGAWYQIRHRLQDSLKGNQELLYSGRRPAAAPATGIPQMHSTEQHDLVAAADHRLHARTVRARHHPSARHGQHQEEVMSTIEVRVPQLPESVADATLVAWRKQPGDAVNRDENLVDLETDKVVLEVPAPASGVLREIKVQNGTTVTGGQILAVIEEGAVAAASPARQGATAAAAAGEVKKDSDKLAPSVRRLVEEHKLAPADIAGSGRDGRITKGDVLTHLADKSAAPAAARLHPQPVAEPRRNAGAVAACR